MIVCILSTKFSIFIILTISLLLCINISSIISEDQINENSINNQTDSTDEINQTTTNDESTSQSIDNLLSDLNTETTTSTILPILEHDISTENKSEILDEIPLTTVSPIIADSQTNDDQQQTTPSTIKKNLSSINSFEEWKQQQLHADLSKKGETTNRHSISSETPAASLLKGSSSPTNIQQGTSTNGSPKKGKLRKNFASASCGAKILAHNIEAQNVASILSSSPDEYMLNPCNVKIWFVIELCESIRILNIEIANFELFSSVPKTFRVSASDRYPTKDWHRHYLGTFNASFNRTIQSFQTIESTTYLKYIKFELLDFHGHEHYCPLSVVRIHGSNVEDELMTMEENTNLIEFKSLTDIQDEDNNNDDDDDNNNEDLTNDQQVGGIIGSAILDLAKRVFRRQTIRGTTSTTTIPIIETNRLENDCHQTVLNGSLTNDHIQSWHYNDTFKQCIAEFLYDLWSRFDTCTIYLSKICFQLNYCCQCPLILEKNNQSKTTLNLYIHSCGYYHILTSQFICQKEKFHLLNKTIMNNKNHDLSQEFSEKNINIEKNETMIITDENTNISSNQSILYLTNSLFNETQIQLMNEQSSSNNISNETIFIFESEISINTTNEISSQSSILDSIHIDLNITESSIEINHTEEMNTITTTTTTTTTSSSILNNNEVITPLISSPWLKGMLVNTKSLPELFKIIEKLNFNLTLSNRYLQELSQHYVKKLDETQQTTDLLLNSSKAADEKLKNFEEDLYKLQENFLEISCRLIKLEAWLPLIICTILCLFIWCIWLTCGLIRLRRKFKYLNKDFEQMKKIKQIENNDDDDEDENDSLRITNGFNKRKLSTDSSDSNPTRSQRVPDVSLPKIIENGIGKHKHKHKLKGKPSNQPEHLLSLNTIHT